jgi:uncharacterized protein (DUF488 family)
MIMSKIYTIGFTKKSAEEFFALLRDNNITLVADIRLNNSSQLAGYTKGKDLKFFLSLVKIKYEYWNDFAPTKELREAYRTDQNFNNYTTEYTQLIAQRAAVSRLKADLFYIENVCLLCSEATPEKCHRRIAADLIAQAIPNLCVKHL